MPDLFTELKATESQVAEYTFKRVASQDGPTILNALGRIYGRVRGSKDETSLLDEAVRGIDFMNSCDGEEKFETQKKYVMEVISRLLKSCSDR